MKLALAAVEEAVYFNAKAEDIKDVLEEADFDLFQPKTDLFPTCALIRVHFKTVH